MKLKARWMLQAFWTLTLVASRAGAAPAAEAPDQATGQPPNAQSVIQRASQVSQADWDAAPKYSCQEKDRTPNGTKTYEDLMIDGSPYQRLIAVNDQPVSGAAKQKEDRNLQHATATRNAESADHRQRRIAQYEKERRRDHLMMQELNKAFDFQLAGQDRLNGHEVFVIKATPKASYQPPNTETKALTGMQGTLWIDTRTYQWVKVEAKAVRPVSIVGFLARVEPGTMFELEKAPVANGVWLPSHYSMRARAKIMWLISKRESDDETYSNCHSVGAPTQLSQSSQKSAAGH